MKKWRINVTVLTKNNNTKCQNPDLSVEQNVSWKVDDRLKRRTVSWSRVPHFTGIKQEHLVSIALLVIGGIFLQPGNSYAMLASFLQW